jgi:3,4-dihydroxy-2-butanone 4-phosphate synthase
MMPLAGVADAIAELRAGRMVVIVDDERRENEGDVAIAAQHVTPEAVNFLVREARGLVCTPIAGARLDALEIPLMVPPNGVHCTAFTVSVDARARTSTGISARDRAETVRCLLDPAARADDFVRPGHVFPLRYREGGVLVRQGHTEASVDLTLAAGLYPAAVICEVMNDDGSMARLPDLLAFGRRHRLPVVTIDALVAFRRAQRTNGAASLAVPVARG